MLVYVYSVGICWYMCIYVVVRVCVYICGCWNLYMYMFICMYVCVCIRFVYVYMNQGSTKFSLGHLCEIPIFLLSPIRTLIIWFEWIQFLIMVNTRIIKLSNFYSRSVENETKYIHFLTLVTQFLD